MPDPEMVLGLGSLGSLLVLRSLDEVDFVVFGDMALVFFEYVRKLGFDLLCMWGCKNLSFLRDLNGRSHF